MLKSRVRLCPKHVSDISADRLAQKQHAGRAAQVLCLIAYIRYAAKMHVGCQTLPIWLVILPFSLFGFGFRGGELNEQWFFFSGNLRHKLKTYNFLEDNRLGEPKPEISFFSVKFFHNGETGMKQKWNVREANGVRVADRAKCFQKSQRITEPRWAPVNPNMDDPNSCFVFFCFFVFLFN